MSERIIRSHGGSQLLKDCLVSLFALEASAPSREIYLISPWVGNALILDNRFNRYSDLFPFAEGKALYLSDLLRAFAWKGTTVRIVCDPQYEPTTSFVELLGDVDRIEFRSHEKNHAKGLCAESFYLHGSMNFTHHGLYMNGEQIRVTCEQSKVMQALLSARALWKEAMPI